LVFCRARGQSLNCDSPEPEIDPKVIFKPLKPSHIKQWQAEKKTSQQVINNNPSNSQKKLDETNDRPEVSTLKAAAKQTGSQITNTFLPGNANWKTSTRAESPQQTLAVPAETISRRPRSLSYLSAYPNVEQSPIIDSDRDSGIASATSLSAASIPQLLLEEANAGNDARDDSDFSDGNDVSDQEDKTFQNKSTCRTRRQQSRSPEKSMVASRRSSIELLNYIISGSTRCQPRMWKTNDSHISQTPPKFNGVEIRKYDQTEPILSSKPNENNESHGNAHCPFQLKVWHRRVGKYSVRKTFPEEEDKPYNTFQDTKQCDTIAGSRNSNRQVIDHENAQDTAFSTKHIRGEIKDHDDNKTEKEIRDHVKANEIESASINIKEEIAKMRAEVAQMRAEVTDIGDHESDREDREDSLESFLGEEDSWRNYSCNSLSPRIQRMRRSGTETSEAESEWSYSCQDEESLSRDSEQS